MKKFYLYLILILILVILGIYFWKSFEIRGLEKRMDEQKSSLTKKTQSIFDSKTNEFLSLVAILLSWAIQKETVSENYGLIDSYFIELVKKPNMKLILLSTIDGKVVVSTDKSLEGKEVFSVIPIELMETSTIRVDEDINENLRVVAPIFNLNQKIGVLVILYSKEKIYFKEED